MAAQGCAVTLSETAGVRYLHFGTEWIQGAMRLSRPYRLELDYQQQMMAPLLFVPTPGRILQLGLGAAALTKFCHRYLRSSHVTAVEIDADVIRLARRWFALPPNDHRLQVVHADAAAHLPRCSATTDCLQVDLYDAQACGPVLDDAGFYAHCRSALRPGGVAAFNLFGHTLAPSLERIAAAFAGRVLRLARNPAGNTIVLAFAAAAPAFNTAPAWDADTLRRRAGVWERRFRMPASDWLDGLRHVNGRRALLPPGGTLSA